MFSRFQFSLPLGLALVTLSLSCSSGGELAASSPSDALPVSPAIAQQTDQQTDQPPAVAPSDIDNSDVLSAIATSQVVYLGETHNSEADHTAQLEIIEALDEQNDLAIGLEMFQRPFQPVLDRYLADEITEAELIAQSEYETRWGWDWEFYAPIIRYAKANQIPLIALNTPAEITRKVAREGLKSLSGDDLTYIPPVAEIDTTDEAYRESVSAVFGAHGGMGHSLDFENFFAAQVLWDETMAESVVTQLAAEPDRQIVVLVGEGHIAYDYGIPNRVERRLPEVSHASVRLMPANEAVDPEFSDFAWLTP
ncbi:MAG: ChaN family lipoprotein [Cyanobacteria bacterium J06606_4]